MEKDVHAVLRNPQMRRHDWENLGGVGFVLFFTKFSNAHEEGIGTRSITATKQHCHVRNNLDHHVLLRLSRGGRQGRAELLQKARQVLDCRLWHICLDPQVWHFLMFSCRSESSNKS